MTGERRRDSDPRIERIERALYGDEQFSEDGLVREVRKLRQDLRDIGVAMRVLKWIGLAILCVITFIKTGSPASLKELFS